ncbi:hypothetical protein C2W64_03759 [Brevibacillus laterosporus]|nr:non-ribosomal peptide synthetase [Brevibacillus laterosporus]RAP29410.1 hypothetical protein C2W64_03759 [Brevibacillus laterosporus]
MSANNYSQQVLLANGYFVEEEKYWKEQFKKDGHSSRFPADNNQLGGGSVRSIGITFPLALSGKLLQVTKGSPYSVLVFLLSGVSGLLYKYTAETDVLIGTPISKEDETEMMEGALKILPIHSKLNPQEPFKNLIYQTNSLLQEAIKHQSFPQSKLIEIVEELEKNTASLCMNTIVLLENFQNAQFITEMEQDMAFCFSITEEQIHLTVYYKDSLYKEESVVRIMKHLHVFFESAMQAPSTLLYQINIISEEERENLFYKFNDTEVEYPLHITIAEWFDSQVKRTPDYLAVYYEGQTLTYLELQKKSNQLAHFLRKKGVQAGDIIPLLARPSIEMIVGLWGIVKTGAAFLPIDPDYPKSRIEYMLHHSGSSLLVTQTALPKNVEYAGEIVEINGLSLCEQEEASPLSIHSTSEDIAYVVYTSGTTGEPKGVMVSQRSLTNLCRWHINFFDVTDQDKASKIAGFGFDASVWEVFPYLLAGAAIYVIPEQLKLDLPRLNQYFEEHKITIGFLPTPLCEKFVHLQNCSLKKLVTGGDVLRSYVKQDYQLINNYGPSEYTVVTTSHPICGDTALIPIGKPIHNTQVYILDSYDQVQPIGVAGEICISGEGLAKGYLQNEELTNKHFVDHPYLPGKTMYRTGDYAKWLSDGTIQYVGRQDNQVKIQGVRVEIREIEKSLLKLSDITDCIVLVDNQPDGSNALIAYYVATRPLTAMDVKKGLATYLPEAMIPSTLIQLNEIPLTANGKVDKKALPTKESFLAKEDDVPVLLTDTEKEMREIWKDILQVEHVGLHRNFFDIGGNSLILVDMHQRLEERYPNKLTVADLFTYTSIYELAAFVDQRNEQKREGPTFERVDFPHDYLKDRECGDDRDSIEWNLDRDVCKDLHILCKQESISIETVMLSSFIYVLHNITHQNQISVLVMNPFFSRVRNISADFQALHHFSELFKTINEKITLTDALQSGEYAYSDLLNKEASTKNLSKHLLLPCFSYEREESNHSLPFGDILVRVIEREDELICRINYGSLINPDKMRELASVYMELLHIIIKKDSKE